MNIFEVPVPRRTDTYSPVSHKEILDEVHEQLDRHNFQVSQHRIQGARNGHQAIGFVDIVNSTEREIGFRLLFKNSYDKSMSVGFAAGNVVWVCSNGLIAGEVVYVRKHTGNVATELKQRIGQAINQLADHYEKVARQADRMKQIEVDKTAAAELCGRMYMEENIIQATQLSVIKNEFAKPSYDYGYPNSLWQLYNFSTHALKSSHPMNYMKQHIKLHNFIEKTYWLE